MTDDSLDAFLATGGVRLLRSAYLLTGDRELAEDLVQTTLLRTARRWEVARRAPDAYAHRVLVNLSHDRWRALRRRVRERPLGALDVTDARGAAVEDDAPGAVERLTLMAAVRSLPRRQREVLVLRFYADLSVADTAAAIGASEGTVKTHTSRALAALRRTLGEPPRTPTPAREGDAHVQR